MSIRRVVLLSFISLAGCSVAPHLGTPARQMSPPSMSGPAAFLALSVKDLEAMLRWYRDTLGFEVYSEGALPERPIRFALLRSGHALIELLQIRDAKPLREAAPGVTAAHEIHGFFKGGLIVPDIEAEYERLRQRQVTFEYGLVKPPNGPYRTFGLRDPEGNLLQFFGR